METWGRGIKKICEACKNHGIKNPKLDVLGGDITAKLKGLRDSKTSLQDKNDALGDALGDALDDALEKRIFEVIRKNNQLNQNEIADILESSRASIQRKTKRMADAGIIERKGGKRFGYWEIVEKSR